MAESTIIARDVQLAELTRSRLHVCHVSTAESVEVLRWAKQRIADTRRCEISAEVTPHHLLLTTDEVLGYDPTYKVNPPLRPAEDVEALRVGLVDGTIDAVATDHAPHARHDKEHAFADAAFGMVGLETALGVVVETMINTGRLDWEQLATRMSYRAGPDRPVARPGPPDRGRRAGESDPGRPRRPEPVVDAAASRSLSRNNPWHGRDLPDPVVATVAAGRITYQRS